MRALVLRGSEFSLEEVARPSPGPGQLMVRVLAAGICGSDLHIVQSGRMGADTGVVLGHEFVGEVVETGEGVDGWKPGARVTSMPLLFTGDDRTESLGIGLDPRTAGGFGEYLVMSDFLALEVPAHLPDEVAATTEPCAVGLHAVRAVSPRPDQSALIMGAGPIGLMTLLWLRKLGLTNIIVSDFSADRRELAQKLGAPHVIDPGTRSAADAAEELLADSFTPVSDRSIAFSAGPTRAAPDIVFECVGVPGTLQQAIDLVQVGGQVVVVGVYGGEDRVSPASGIMREATVRFVLGYTREDFSDALAALGDGSIDPSPMVSAVISLEELPQAFADLAEARHCKIVARPSPSAPRSE